MFTRENNTDASCNIKKKPPVASGLHEYYNVGSVPVPTVKLPTAK